MASLIDATKQIQGAATTASVRANFAAAKAEIEALQADVAANLATLNATTSTANTALSNAATAQTAANTAISNAATVQTNLNAEALTRSNTDIALGGRLTALEQSSGGGWHYIVLGADVTHSAITNLQLTALQQIFDANSTYAVECHLLVRTATTTSMPRVGFTGGVWATNGASLITEPFGVTGTPLFAAGRSLDLPVIAAGTMTPANQSFLAIITSLVVTDATNASTGYPTIASETAGVVSTVKKGSFLRFQKIA